MNIIIKGEVCNIIQLMNEECEETTNAAEACFILYQRLDDKKPNGINQAYTVMAIPKGSLQIRALS